VVAVSAKYLSKMWREEKFYETFQLECWKKLTFGGFPEIKIRILVGKYRLFVAKVDMIFKFTFETRSSLLYCVVLCRVVIILFSWLGRV
jgi:hypothetical protein